MKREIAVLAILALTGLALLWNKGETCVTVYSLAYYQGSGYAVPLEICASQGFGRVFLNMDRQYDYVFQESVRNVAALLKNKHGYLLDYKIMFKGEPVYITGASASLAIYAGMYMASEGLKRGPIAFSGQISGDGKVLPVEHVYTKIEGFAGPVVLPKDVCVSGAVCVSNVDELETYLKGE